MVYKKRMESYSCVSYTISYQNFEFYLIDCTRMLKNYTVEIF